jgi:hypothetical protein
VVALTQRCVTSRASPTLLRPRRAGGARCSAAPGACGPLGQPRHSLQGAGACGGRMPARGRATVTPPPAAPPPLPPQMGGRQRCAPGAWGPGPGRRRLLCRPWRLLLGPRRPRRRRRWAAAQGPERAAAAAAAAGAAAPQPPPSSTHPARAGCSPPPRPRTPQTAPAAGGPAPAARPARRSSRRAAPRPGAPAPAPSARSRPGCSRAPATGPAPWCRAWPASAPGPPTSSCPPPAAAASGARRVARPAPRWPPTPGCRSRWAGGAAAAQQLDRPRPAASPRRQVGGGQRCAGCGGALAYQGPCAPGGRPPVHLPPSGPSPWPHATRRRRAPAAVRRPLRQLRPHAPGRVAAAPGRRARGRRAGAALRARAAAAGPAGAPPQARRRRAAAAAPGRRCAGRVRAGDRGRPPRAAAAAAALPAQRARSSARAWPGQRARCAAGGGLAPGPAPGPGPAAGGGRRAGDRRRRALRRRVALPRPPGRGAGPLWQAGHDGLVRGGLLPAGPARALAGERPAARGAT